MQQGTVLAGQDGVSPAISQQTGQPITIEDLLRQRGLMAAGGKMSIYPNVPNASAPNPNTVTSSAPDVNTTTSNASSPNPMDVVVNNRIAQSEANVLPPGADTSDIPQVFDEKPVGINTPGGDMSDFLPWLIGGAAGGGGIAALLAMRNRRKGGSSGINDPEFGANTGPAPVPGGAANGDGNTTQPRLMQGSNSAVGRARRMQAGTVDGGTIQGRAAPSAKQALIERQKLLTGPKAAPASQQTIEGVSRPMLENRSGVNATIANSAKTAPESLIYGEDYSPDAGVRATVGRSVKDAMKKRALKRVRVR
jgi:hypothetical protein